MPQQEEEIDQTQELFQVETKKYEEQMEKLSLLSKEPKEMQDCGRRKGRKKSYQMRKVVGV